MEVLVDILNNLDNVYYLVTNSLRNAVKILLLCEFLLMAYYVAFQKLQKLDDALWKIIQITLTLFIIFNLKTIADMFMTGLNEVSQKIASNMGVELPNIENPIASAKKMVVDFFTAFWNALNKLLESRWNSKNGIENILSIFKKNGYFALLFHFFFVN